MSVILTICMTGSSGTMPGKCLTPPGSVLGGSKPPLPSPTRAKPSFSNATSKLHPAEHSPRNGCNSSFAAKDFAPTQFPRSGSRDCHAACEFAGQAGCQPREPPSPCEPARVSFATSAAPRHPSQNWFQIRHHQDKSRANGRLRLAFVLAARLTGKSFEQAWLNF